MQKIIIKSYESKKSIVMPIVFLIVGIILFLNPGKIVEFISYIIGGVFLALGIGKMLSDSKRPDRTTGDTFYSILMIILAVIFIFFSDTVEFLFRLSIGLWIIMNALNTIIIGSNMVKLDKRNVVTLILGLILLSIGLYTIFVENVILSTLGIIVMIYSILEIFDYFYIINKTK